MSNFNTEHFLDRYNILIDPTKNNVIQIININDSKPAWWQNKLTIVIFGIIILAGLVVLAVLAKNHELKISTDTFKIEFKKTSNNK